MCLVINFLEQNVCISDFQLVKLYRFSYPYSNNALHCIIVANKFSNDILYLYPLASNRYCTFTQYCCHLYPLASNFSSLIPLSIQMFITCTPWLPNVHHLYPMASKCSSLVPLGFKIVINRTPWLPKFPITFLLSLNVQCNTFADCLHDSYGCTRTSC